jgi:spore coat protein A, manganese oxidase
MNINRREALKLGLVGTGSLLSPFQFVAPARAEETSQCSKRPSQCSQQPSSLNTQNPTPSPQIERFQHPLHIPEPLQPVRSTDDINYYEITMQKRKLEILPASNGKPPITAEFWTYNGTNPGPLIRQKKRHQSCIRFINELGQDGDSKDICTSIHLHGMASLPQYDGYAEDLIPPGYYKDYYYPNNRASILWYHDHALHKTSRNVYMGLAGMYVVEYEKDNFCNPDQFECLPKGEFEIPLIIQDKTFEVSPSNSNEWKLVFNDRRQQGVYADLFLVNGVPYPYLKVKRRKYFFRLLNASASRTYQLTLSNNETTQVTNNDAYQLIVIGSDAGLLAEPVPLTAPEQSLRMGIGERYGVIIDFSKFPSDVKSVYLRNLVFHNNLGVEPQALMRFDLLDEPATPTCELPKALGIMTERQALIDRAVANRTFRFGRAGNKWVINGKTWSPARIDANPGQCDIEIWDLVNTGGWVHPVHIHLIDFRIISRNGLPPLPYEQGWKDVVLLDPSETVRVVARFFPHRGKYMMHCHNIVHEDHDMMNQFEVGSGGIDPCSEPAKLLPAPPLGSVTPPPLIESELPSKCFEELPNQCRGGE